MIMTNDQLQALYLKWTNDYLTVAVFADHHSMTDSEARDVIERGRKIHEHRVIAERQHLPTLGANQ